MGEGEGPRHREEEGGILDRAIELGLASITGHHLQHRDSQRDWERSTWWP
jgi:hypothetical protein